jgi:hypothetical protein
VLLRQASYNPAFSPPSVQGPAAATRLVSLHARPYRIPRAQSAACRPPLSYHRHGYSTTSRLAKDPRRSLQRNLPCQLACRGLLFNLSKAGLYLPGQDPRNFKEVSDLQVSPPGAKFACWALERKCRGCIVVHLEPTRDAFVEARPGREKISRNLLYAHIPHSTPPGFVLLASRIPTFSSSIDFEP